MQQATTSLPFSRHPEDSNRVQTMCWTEMAPWHYTVADLGRRVDDAWFTECMLMLIAGPKWYTATVLCVGSSLDQ